MYAWNVLSRASFFLYNEYPMGIWAYRHLFSQIAVVLIALFVTVLSMHALISHDHKYESFGTGMVLPVHSATGEKFFAIALPASLFVAFSTIRFIKNIFLERKLRGQKRHPDIVAKNIERLLFSRGILHTKVY